MMNSRTLTVSRKWIQTIAPISACVGLIVYYFYWFFCLNFHSNHLRIEDNHHSILPSHPTSGNTQSQYQDYDMVILFWSNVFGAKASDSWINRANAFNDHICNITNQALINQKILITDDKALKSFANAVVFHAPDTSMKTVIESNKQSDDVYIMYSRETPVTLKNNLGHDTLSNAPLLSQFNLLMSYHMYADIPIPWNTQKTLKDLCDLKTIRSFKEKNKTKADVLWIGSNCNAYNGRQLYLKELFKHINADSLGKCLKSDENVVLPPTSVPLTDLISKYKFYIVMENSNCDGYISEKLGKAIKATTIPIVFSVDGTPDYDQFMPFHSYINAADFGSAKELASYLKSVGSNEALYDSFFHYKSSGECDVLMEKYPFRRFDDVSFENQWCNAANVVYNYQKMGNERHLNVDDSCLQKNVMFDYK
eukprot:256148_1